MPQATLNFNYVDKRTINALYENCLCFTALDDNFVLSITRGYYNHEDINEQNYNFYYSLDNGYTWSAIQLLYHAGEESDETISIPAINNGNKILIRGYNNTTLDGINFSTSKNCNVSGNIMTLLDYDTALTRNSIPEYCFYKLFRRAKILDASKLILPDFVSTCAYLVTFEQCRELIAAPELPATTLAYGCYAYMFNGCRSLTSAPELPATTLADNCYVYMFGGCTSLTTAPALPATTLTQFCYNSMFRGCDALSIPPALPATTLANNCYELMFSGCTALVQPPGLPATTLAISCYRRMFFGCTSMTYAPYLPADYIPNMAYAYMFSGCTSLNYINIHATQRESNSLNNWVQNVAPTGTFIKHPNATYDIDSVSGVPIGWTVYNDGDDIPNMYEVTLHVNESEWGTTIGSGYYPEGSSIQVEAIPNTGYVFKWWDFDNEYVSSNPLTITVNEDIDITAVFVAEETPTPEYTVTLQTMPNNISGFELIGAGTYQEGSDVPIDIVEQADGAQMMFTGWYTLQNNEYVLYTEDHYFEYKLYDNITFYAQLENKPTIYYNVFAGLDQDSLGFGTVTGSGSYVSGREISVTATPKTGYEFVYWRIDDQYNVADNPYTFKVTKDTQLLAHIRPIVEKYELTVENNDPWHSDIIVRDEGSRLYGEKIIDDYESNAQIEQMKYYVSENTTVTLTAQNKYVDLLEFDGWYTIDDEYITTLVSTEQQYSFVVNGPMKICGKWKIIDTIDETDYSQEYFTITALGDCAVYADIILHRNQEYDMHHTAISYTLEYSINGGEWQQKIIAKSNEDSRTETTVQVADLAATDKMRIRCVMPWEYTYDNKKYIVKHVTLRTASIVKDRYDIWPLGEIPCRISGNLMSLVYGSEFLNNNTLGYNYLRFPFDLRNILDAYNVVFPLLSDPSLNTNWENRATYYANWENYIDFDKNGWEISKRDGGWYDGTYHYWSGRFGEILSDNKYMLRGPKSIGPNTYEGDYKGLLKNNHNLYNAPLCPAEIIAPVCYSLMLQNCHSLQKPVPVLPALELQSFCYNSMYERCYMLQDPGILPANIMAISSYENMYAGCRSMMTGPEIPVETLNINNASGNFHLMFGDCINMSFLEVHFKYREGGDFGLGYILGYPESYKELNGGDDPEGWAKENLARKPQKPGRFYRYANTAIDPYTGKPWMSRETLAYYGTEFPDNWTFEDITT